MKALLVGASGLVGSNCLDFLLNDHTYSQVEIWVRRKTGRVHPKLVEKIIDFDNYYRDQVSTDINQVFCCLGTTKSKSKTKEAYHKIDVTYVIELAKWSENNNVESFAVISSIGANWYSSSEYLQNKGAMEQNVKLCKIPSITIFRPSLLLGNRQEFRLLEKISIGFFKTCSFLFVGSVAKYKGIEATDVAKALVKIAKLKKPGFTIYESNEIQEIALQ